MDTLRLLISYRGGKFHEAVFPNNMKHRHYYIADVSEGQVGNRLQNLSTEAPSHVTILIQLTTFICNWWFVYIYSSRWWCVLLTMSFCPTCMCRQFQGHPIIQWSFLFPWRVLCSSNLPQPGRTRGWGMCSTYMVCDFERLHIWVISRRLVLKVHNW